LRRLRRRSRNPRPRCRLVHHLTRAYEAPSTLVRPLGPALRPTSVARDIEDLDGCRYRRRAVAAWINSELLDQVRWNVSSAYGCNANRRKSVEFRIQIGNGDVDADGACLKDPSKRGARVASCCIR
jgi:hypothetical protein